MDVKSDVVILINAVGTGHQLIEILKGRLQKALGDGAAIFIDGIASSKDEARLKLNSISLTDDLKEVLDDWWIDDCLTLTKSDVSATGRFVIWTVDHIEEDFSFGPHNLGVSIGINVPDFKYDDIVLNEEIKGQPGVSLYEFEVSHDTSKVCSVSVYAHSKEEAEEHVIEADNEGLPYEDSIYWGDAILIQSC
jgi:hypothetical protein